MSPLFSSIEDTSFHNKAGSGWKGVLFTFGNKDAFAHFAAAGRLTQIPLFSTVADEYLSKQDAQNSTAGRQDQHRGCTQADQRQFSFQADGIKQRKQ